MTTALTYDKDNFTYEMVEKLESDLDHLEQVEKDTSHEKLKRLMIVRRMFAVKPQKAQEYFQFNEFYEYCKWKRNYHQKTVRQLEKMYEFMVKNQEAVGGIHVFQELPVSTVNVIRRAVKKGYDLNDLIYKAQLYKSRIPLEQETQPDKPTKTIHPDKKPDKQVTEDIKNYLKELQGMSASYIPRESVVKRIKGILA